MSIYDTGAGSPWDGAGDPISQPAGGPEVLSYGAGDPIPDYSQTLVPKSIDPYPDEDPLYDFGFYFGHPAELGGVETLTRGFGDVHTSSAEDYDPAMAPGFQVVTLLRNGEFGDDGGSLVTLYSPGQSFPGRGPYRVRLIDANDGLWPPLSEVACYSARAGQLDAALASRSLELLHFALPVLPQGRYGVRLTWADAAGVAQFADVLLVVPAERTLESEFLTEAWA